MTDGSVASVLDSHISRSEKPRPPDGKWHPSSLFECERKALYEIRGVEPSNAKDARNRRILHLGTTLHGVVQEAFTAESGAVAVYHEVAIEIPTLGVIGHCDTLEQFADGTWQLDEWKTIGMNGLIWGMKKGELPKEPHVKQAKTYAAALMEYGGTFSGAGESEQAPQGVPPLGDSLKRIRFGYFSRDDLRIEEFTIEPDPTWGLELADLIGRLERYREDGVALPPRLADKQADHWLCKSFCTYRTRCWGADNEGVQL